MAEIDIKAEAATLDRIDVVYDVVIRVSVTAGVYSGVLDNDGIARLVMDRGIHGDDIQSAVITDVNLDDTLIAAAAGSRE